MFTEFSPNENKVVKLYSNEKIDEENWLLQFHLLHRPIDEGPAIEEYLNGKLFFQGWHEHGEIHRIGKPAILEYWPNGQVKNEEWFVNGYKYRDNKEDPIFIQYNDKGDVIERRWRYGKTESYDKGNYNA